MVSIPAGTKKHTPDISTQPAATTTPSVLVPLRYDSVRPGKEGWEGAEARSRTGRAMPPECYSTQSPRPKCPASAPRPQVQGQLPSPQLEFPPAYGRGSAQTETRNNQAWTQLWPERSLVTRQIEGQSTWAGSSMRTRVYQIYKIPEQNIVSRRHSRTIWLYYMYGYSSPAYAFKAADQIEEVRRGQAVPNTVRQTPSDPHDPVRHLVTCYTHISSDPHKFNLPTQIPQSRMR